ncbi:MAG: hypothetical protein KDD29_07175, partial [Flavobacteriales bacterium]|nr:hypothetical protein [Flavobacteriales bacterium]
DDYWNLSEQLFNFLIYDKSPTDVSTYKISSSYFQENLNMSSDYFLDTGPYEIIQYNIRIKPSQHNKYLANAKILNYNWDTFNCGEITERIMHPKEIDEHEKKIEFILLNGNKSNRKKTELYLVKFRGSEFEMNIKCTKSFSLYSKPLRNELFIVRVMKKINYYSKEYGCVEIVAVN